MEAATTSDDATTRPKSDGGLLPRHLCRVMGTNQNHSSRSGTSYDVQVEDRGPVFDDATEGWVRRVNVIAYANYGEPTARIVYGKDHDFPDIRTHEHNRAVAQRLQEISVEVRAVLEEKEERLVARVKDLLERYYRTRDDKVKREFEDANALYPFAFARAFQELKAERSSDLRTLITDQTLEPTQVAGFNQFFDDVDATEACAYGLGVDQKFSKSVYAGAEFLYRDLSVPYLTLTDFGNLTYADAPWEEYLGRAYIYWAPHDWLAFRLEYGYEKMECTDQVNLGAIRVDTHSVPLGVNFFHPSGFFAGLKATWSLPRRPFYGVRHSQCQERRQFILAGRCRSWLSLAQPIWLPAGVTNLFDKEGFNYWEKDTNNSRIQPDRQAFIAVTLALP